jgi:hypothetical protein
MPYRDSAAATATLTLQGVWLHDADAPDETVTQYPYGASMRETNIDAMGAGSYFAGRSAPVFDFGEHEAQSVPCGIDVPHGIDYTVTLATLEAWARLKKPMWFRDNRGRAVFGVMQGYRAMDQDWGSAVSFTIVEADIFIESVVA